MSKSADYKSSETVDSHVNKAVRPIIKGFIGDLKSSVKEAADGKATFEELATREYNNMSEDSRIRALNAYEKIQDNLDKKKRVPFDKTNGSHLLILKALDEALSTGDTIF